jgi:hypothetical protein
MVASETLAISKPQGICGVSDKISLSLFWQERSKIEIANDKHLKNSVFMDYNNNEVSFLLTLRKVSAKS